MKGDRTIDVAGDGTDYQVSTKAGRDKASKLMEKCPKSLHDSMDMEKWLIKHGVKPADAAALFVEFGD